VTPASGPPPNRRYGHPLTLVAIASGALVAGVVGATIATSSAAPARPAPAAAQFARPTATPAPGTPAPRKAAPGKGAPSTPPPGAWRPGRPPSFRGPGRPFAFPFGGFLFPGRAVHGQFVIPATGGGYQTEAIPSGRVTAVSGSSLTVRSADNFTRSYRVTSAVRVLPGHGISSVKSGDQVRVMATVHGSAATVTIVIDVSQLRSKGWAPGGGQHWPAAGSGG
jgi:hypothetical protein